MGEQKKNDRLKDSKREREVRGLRHKIRQLLRNGEYEQAEELEPKKIEKEER